MWVSSRFSDIPTIFGTLCTAYQWDLSYSLSSGHFYKITTNRLGFEIKIVYLNIASYNHMQNEELNLLATDFFFQILAHPVFKLWVIQKPNKVALWNKRHFEGEKMEIIQHV